MPNFIRRAQAALAVSLALAAAPAAAETIEIVSGNRGFTLAAFGPTGQSFVAADTSLTSFGFLFNALNPGAANLPFTFTLPTSINTRALVWYDIDITGTGVTRGQRYTAVLSGGSSRNSVSLGPTINIFTGAELSGDAYAAGRALFTREVYANCARTGNCDLNFRVSGVTPAVAPVPEPASWALMIAGVGLIGAAARRRAAPRTLTV